METPLNDLSVFTLVAAVIAAVISLAKKIGPVAGFLEGKERAASVALGVLAAFLGRQFGFLEVAGEGFMAFVTTGAALAAASGVAYEQLLKMFSAKPSTAKRLDALETKSLN